MLLALLDFRLYHGGFGGRGGPPAKVVHLVDAPGQVAGHVDLAGSVAGDLGLVLNRLAEAVAALPGRRPRHPGRGGSGCATRPGPRSPPTGSCWTATPTRSIRPGSGALRVLADDAVVIGDGGDFVSLRRPVRGAGPAGQWLDPGPYGCLGTGLGHAIAARLARPWAQVVLLLGDGAAGFSLMDVDTLVATASPVVLVGNNGILGLEKHPCGCCRPQRGRRPPAVPLTSSPGRQRRRRLVTTDPAGPGPAPRLRRRRPLPDVPRPEVAYPAPPPGSDGTPGQNEHAPDAVHGPDGSVGLVGTSPASAAIQAPSRPATRRPRR